MMNLIADEKIQKIKKTLIEKGDELRRQPIKLPVSFVKDDEESNSLTSDLKTYPHAFLLGCIADRQVKFEIAWKLPLFIKKSLGSFCFEDLESLSLERITELVKKGGHRFWPKVGKSIHQAIKQIGKKYSGNASRIWANTPSSATIVFRFLQFDGVGPKIATMAANILARDFKIPMSDYYSIDVSVDTHVRLVFQRTGVIPNKNCSNDEIIYFARSLYPEYPGILDLPCFDIGIKYCHKGNKKPECSKCYLNEICPKNI